MSGEGILSVRLPLSLLGILRAIAGQQSMTIHETARRVLAGLSSLTPDQLRELKEPPREIASQRISLYVGWPLMDELAEMTQDAALTNSAVFRRLLYALLVTNQVLFVQQNGSWKLQIVSPKNAEKNSTQGTGKPLSCA
jgi:hypothetical protein